jgi:2-phospho-L-lactate guanylyltransferase (CobY/MobA/RfbA family)
VRENFDMMIVAHGDLGHPEGLGSAPFDDAVTIVTDRHGTGTNVLAVPTATDFAFSYGPGSAARHLAEAIRRHGRVRVMTDSPWSLDIDEPDDFQILTM